VPQLPYTLTKASRHPPEGVHIRLAHPEAQSAAGVVVKPMRDIRKVKFVPDFAYHNLWTAYLPSLGAANADEVPVPDVRQKVAGSARTLQCFSCFSFLMQR